mmetsp:Transcript_22246/g.56575  ORF Transcript_22246/g.56575 Transcript_22246/m.56575 type:complete len:230 (-) Transcript_22246:827-1516(-)
MMITTRSTCPSSIHSHLPCPTPARPPASSRWQPRRQPGLRAALMARHSYPYPYSTHAALPSPGRLRRNGVRGRRSRARHCLVHAVQQVGHVVGRLVVHVHARHHCARVRHQRRRGRWCGRLHWLHGRDRQAGLLRHGRGSGAGCRLLGLLLCRSCLRCCRCGCLPLHLCHCKSSCTPGVAHRGRGIQHHPHGHLLAANQRAVSILLQMRACTLQQASFRHVHVLCQHRA